MKLLIAYDGSTHAEAAVNDLDRAGLPANTHAIVLSVMDHNLVTPRSYGMVETDFAGEWMQRIEAVGRAAEEVSSRLQSRFPGWTIQMETPPGHAAEIILDRAKTWPADLVVVGTHGRSPFAKLILGSVSTKLIRDASCSVRVARSTSGWRQGPIRLLVGTDGSPEADEAVNEVCRRVWPSGTHVRLAAVDEVLAHAHATMAAGVRNSFRDIDAQEHRWLEGVTAMAADKLERAGLAVSCVVDEGDAKETLVHEARSWNADTVFVGARGLGQLERFMLGSVSAAVVTHAPCAVEVVRRHLG